MSSYERKEEGAEMTEADQRLIHAYVTDGKGCWHEYYHIDGMPRHYLCKNCNGQGVLNEDAIIQPTNPDYSTRQHFPDLTAKLFGDERMYGQFELWLSANKWEHPSYAYANLRTGWVLTNFIPWLFFDTTRFVTLFAEFLRLEETVREFGWEDCSKLPASNVPTFCKYAEAEGYVSCYACSGRILRPWAKLVEEGK